LWTIIECLSFLNADFKAATENNICILLIVLLISLISAIIISFPRQKISRRFENLNTEINIEVGNLLDKKGHIIIASSNYFDTKTSKTDSLKTQLIKRYFNNAIDHLDQLINESLAEQGKTGREVNIQEKPKGKRIKHEVGTVVDIQLPSDNNTKIFISVICEVIYVGQTKTKKSDFRMLTKSLEETWSHIRNTNNNKDIYLPILGAGVTGLSLSKSTLIQLISFSYLLNSKESKIGKSLNIVIPESNYEPELFEEINNYLNTFKI
jgi:hypothetical protein